MIRLLGILCLTLVTVITAARADWDEQPGLDYDGQSTAEHPCGRSAPPRGHRIREVLPNARGKGLNLIVRQEGNRLCYVADGLAEAPVVRVQAGRTLSLTLRNEITDPAAIDKLLAVNTLDRPNPPVPEQVGFYPVGSGIRHQATGATNLHFHGFAVPPHRPQDEVIETCVDPASGPVGCGTSWISYRYEIPATMPTGLYWYHPHVHGEVQAQMLMGLVGAIVVEGPEDEARRAAGIDDRIFVIRQQSDTDAPPAPDAKARPAPRPIQGRRAPQIDGLQVDTAHELGCAVTPPLDQIMLNGAPVVEGMTADADLAPLTIAQGHRQLWRFLNAATDAFLDLALVDEAGKPIPIEVVARDGAPMTDDNGRRRRPIATLESQKVPPAGRVEFLVRAPKPGHKAYLVTHAVDTGCAGDVVPERRLAVLTSTPEPPDMTRETHWDIAKSAPDFFTGLLARPTQRERFVAFAEYPRPGNADQTDFAIFERRPGASIAPFDMHGEPTITVEAGAVEEWVIENWTREVHAFHIHQVHFRLLDIDGKASRDPPLLDTVEVPYATPASDAPDAPLIPGRVRIKLSFPPALAGDILFHCHLVDHEDAGMMGLVRVVLPGETPVQKASLPQDWPGSAICRPRPARSTARIDVGADPL